VGERESEVLLAVVRREEQVQASSNMMDWTCTNCGTTRSNVDFTFLDPKYGNAWCRICKGLRTYMRRLSPEGAVDRTSDPITSHLAADSVQGIRASQRMILGALERHGPGTDEDIFGWLRLEGHKISLSGARTRRSELVSLGYVEDSGEKAMLPSRRLSIIWRKKSRDDGKRSPAT
jgi:hypothetical protein